MQREMQSLACSSTPRSTVQHHMVWSVQLSAALACHRLKQLCFNWEIANEVSTPTLHLVSVTVGA